MLKLTSPANLKIHRIFQTDHVLVLWFFIYVDINKMNTFNEYF